jgi:hypothetical protein
MEEEIFYHDFPAVKRAASQRGKKKSKNIQMKGRGSSGVMGDFLNKLN